MSAAHEIVRLAPGDWSLLRTVRLASLQNSPDAFWPTYAEEIEQPQSWWTSTLTERRTAWFTDGAGTVLVHQGTAYEEEFAHDATLGSLWVSLGLRGSGVAGALIDAAVGSARAYGYAGVRLWHVTSLTAAERLYERHGFALTGRVDTFRPPREHLVMVERRIAL